jgi:5-methylcytosine-specific restriction enzyme A
MVALSNLTATAVNKALDEFDRLGQESFLKKYGFRKAWSYVVKKDGRSYDSKAIAGAAHGYLAGRSALTWKQLSGGRTTVQKTLNGLGFTVLAGGFLPAPGKSLQTKTLGAALLSAIWVECGGARNGIFSF